METIMQRACGLDVHRDTIVATVKGKGIEKAIQTFGTTNSQINALASWVLEYNVEAIVMESTGVYWKPIYDLFESRDVEIYLVNAKSVKNVPGKKTDVKDSEWLCDLLMHGLISTCFIPPKIIRELRDLTRHKRKLVGEIVNEKNRIHKYLENYGIKISSIISDIFGATGMKIIFSLIGEDFDKEKIIPELRLNFRNKSDSLCDALHKGLDKHHKFLIKSCLLHIHSLEQLILNFEEQIDNLIANYNEEMDLLQTVPGVKEDSAKVILSEIGSDMEKFKTAAHLCSWAGVCPGNNESAGKKKSGKIRDGNNNLKTILVQCAWGATRTKNTYLSSKYNSLLRKGLGSKKALIAIAHKMLGSIYYILRYKQIYRDLGGDFLTRKYTKEKTKDHYILKLEKMGFEVILKKA